MNNLSFLTTSPSLKDSAGSSSFGIFLTLLLFSSGKASLKKRKGNKLWMDFSIKGSNCFGITCSYHYMWYRASGFTSKWQIGSTSQLNESNLLSCESSYNRINVWHELDFNELMNWKGAYLSSLGQKTKYSSRTSSLTFWSRLVSWFIITHLLKPQHKHI